MINDDWQVRYLSVEDAFVNYDVASAEELNDRMLADGWRWDISRGMYYIMEEKADAFKVAPI
jgi:hypothetical protein